MSRFRLMTLLLLSLLVAGCDREAPPWHGRNIKGVMPELAFTLTDDNGHLVTADGYAGKVTLLYFGFTHCEDVCPTTLTTLATALHKLGRNAAQVRILFVSVDPHRDTPAVLQRYARHFAPQLVGLSGTPAQLADVTKRYRVTYSYGKPDTHGDYEVYHSGAIFVFDGRGRVRLLLDEQLGANAIAEDLQRLVDHHTR